MSSVTSFRGQYSFLSNFFASPIKFEGKVWPTVEHAYQAAKTLDSNEKTAIRLADTPGKAKRLGRKVHLRPAWETVKLGIMRELVRYKFDQNPALRKKLLATGNAELVEGNTWGDTFWGVCKGKGRNELGKILMQYREDSPGERPAQQGGSEMSTEHVKIYTDGACSGNPGPGGWAAILKYGQHTKEVAGGSPETTNNRMELGAVIEGLKALKHPCSVTVYTDSQYVIGVMTGWKRRANHDLLRELDVLCAEHTVTFQYLRGHAGHPLNERADELATMQREKARSAAQAEDYDTCDRCYKRIAGDELERANHRSDYITYCDECNRRNNAGVAFPDNRPRLHPRRAVSSGFEQLPSAISDMAPVGAG